MKSMDQEMWMEKQEQAFLDEPVQEPTCSYEGCFNTPTTTDASGEVVCDEHLMSE